MRPDDLSDEEILYVVGQADAELFRAGVEVGRRDWEVVSLVMQRFGYESYVMAGPGTPPILERVKAAFRSIYRPQDIATGGHIGVFMYRDVFARISIPIILGRVGINPFDFVELTPVQLRIIQTEPEEIATYLDQFADAGDIQYGTMEMKPPFATMELVGRFIGLARLHRRDSGTPRRRPRPRE